MVDDELLIIHSRRTYIQARSHRGQRPSRPAGGREQHAQIQPSSSLFHELTNPPPFPKSILDLASMVTRAPSRGSTHQRRPSSAAVQQQASPNHVFGSNGRLQMAISNGLGSSTFDLLRSSYSNPISIGCISPIRRHLTMASNMPGSMSESVFIPWQPTRQPTVNQRQLESQLITAPSSHDAPANGHPHPKKSSSLPNRAAVPPSISDPDPSACNPDSSEQAPPNHQAADPAAADGSRRTHEQNPSVAMASSSADGPLIDNAPFGQNQQQSMKQNFKSENVGSKVTPPTSVRLQQATGQRSSPVHRATVRSNEQP
ncbi:hypothetical protein ACLOJK_006593 [Asimina triloba]